MVGNRGIEVGLNAKQLDSILRLLSTLIIIDGRILPEEVDAMGGQISRLCGIIDDGILITPEIAKDWFVNNQRQIGLLLASPDRKKIVAKTMMELVGLNRNILQKLTYAMIRISWADGEYHAEEENYVEMAMKVWGLQHHSLKRQTA